MKKLMAILLASTMIFGTFTGCAGASAPASSAAPAASESTAPKSDAAAPQKDVSEMRIAVVMSGSANDGGWSQMAADAAKAVGDKYGCTVNYSESVGATDTEGTVRGYADAGYDIIVTHGAEFLDADKLIAPEYPNTRFICTSAQSGQEPNLTGIDFATYELGFLCGAASAMASETKKIGVIGSNEIDSIVAWAKGIEDGSKYIDPACETFTVYTGSYDDALKAKQSVDALVPKGVDVITQNADACGIGAVQQSTEHGLLNVGAVSDQSGYGDACFVSIMQDAQHGIVSAIDKAVNGTLPVGFVNMGAADGVISITDYTGSNADVLTQEEKDKLTEMWQMSYDGKHLSELVKK